MKRKWLFFICFLLSLLTMLGGYAGTAQAQTKEPAAAVSPSPDQQLIFSVVENESPGYTLIPKESLGEHINLTMAYSGLKEVNIRLNGADVPLDEAIREGTLTVPEILAFARQDAQNQICKEEYTSEHGLTHFVYRYPACELHLTYDVYETPDGNQTLIEELYVYNITDSPRSVRNYYVDEESKWGYFLDREDWGLTFDIAEVSSDKITLNCTQQKGQQIGALVIEDYLLFPAENYGNPDIFPPYLKKDKTQPEALPISLPNEGTQAVTIDWSAAIGTLDPGEYYLRLEISDIYEESQVHPLMINYYDKQSYYIVFTIE